MNRGYIATDRELYTAASRILLSSASGAPFTTDHACNTSQLYESYFMINKMVFLLYNKFLLRAFVALTGCGLVLAAWQYISLSAQKLPEQGARDALAIISFLIAGWLVMLIAEVLDNHYARVFGCLCLGLGAFTSYPWVFRIDGPKLMEMPTGPHGMMLTALGFWGAAGIGAAMLILLVWRLVLDRLTYGRPLISATHADVNLGPAPATAAPPGRAAANELPPIPIDTSPLLVVSAGQQQPPAVVRQPAPITRLAGIGGVYLGTVYEVKPGQQMIGRLDADLLLTNDNQVSRKHAQLTVEADGCAVLTDLSSANGTFVNNARVQSTQLCPGDTVQFGTSIFKVEG